jgi:LmbE family N-acetylglucosaminyl deacetylase
VAGWGWQVGGGHSEAIRVSNQTRRRTQARHDAHQDHREVCQLTWNLFRDHLILEYAIPKWNGDLSQPNLYVPLTAAALEREIELLLTRFATQRPKGRFNAETFRGLVFNCVS